MFVKIYDIDMTFSSQWF